MKKVFTALRDGLVGIFTVQIWLPWWTSPGNLWDWAVRRREQRRG